MKLDSIMIGTTQAKVLADFYKKVLDQEPAWEDDQGGWYGFKLGNGGIAIGPHSEVAGSNKEPGRIIVNISAQDPRKEFDRIKATGAEVIAEPYEVGDDSGTMTMCTFADPDGNYFQIASVWED